MAVKEARDLYVRGGGPDENLMILDEAPVFNASHLLGFFSVFNSDAINDVQVYKGGIPAEYGGKSLVGNRYSDEGRKLPKNWRERRNWKHIEPVDG